MRMDRSDDGVCVRRALHMVVMKSHHRGGSQFWTSEKRVKDSLGVMSSHSTQARAIVLSTTLPILFARVCAI